MNVSLTAELEELVHRKVRSGRYGSASEVMRDALRLMAERDEMDTLRKEHFRARATEASLPMREAM